MMPLMLAEVEVMVVVASFFAFWVALVFVQKMVRTLAREKSRREIAAYIAEGSMTPEHGERLMKAGEQPE